MCVVAVRCLRQQVTCGDSESRARLVPGVGEEGACLIVLALPPRPGSGSD